MTNKIIIADDHPFMIDGLSNIVKTIKGAQLVATVNNGVELLQLLTYTSADLIILDLNMPAMDGFECIRRIRKEKQRVKILVLTNYSQPELIEEVKRLGADGFLLKNSTADQLSIAIDTVLTGGKYFIAPSQLKPVAEDSFFYDEFLKKFQLTKREVGIMLLICGGKSSKQIADELFLSELTVNTHRRNIMKKLDLSNVAGLIQFARQNALI
jgi:DNA-binding NarL/FixJ family response regulator